MWVHDDGIICTTACYRCEYMIMVSFAQLHVTDVSTWWWYHLHDCMLQMWVHDDGIICTIVCYGIRTMIFQIVIVNPEDNIIVLFAHDSVLQFSSYFCWDILKFVFDVEGLTICRRFAIAYASFDLVLKLKLESPLGTHISEEVVRFLQLQFYQIQ